MNHSIIFSVLLCLGLSACNAETSTPNKPSNHSDVKSINAIQLNIVLNKLRVRDAPSTKSKVISKLSKQDKVMWSGEISQNRDAIKISSVKFNTRWIKIKLNNQSEGWIYAAAAKTDAKVSPLAEKFAVLRSQSFFGESLAKEIAQYRHIYHSASEDKQFAQNYEKGQKLREKMVEVLEKKAEVDDKHVMDMTWLEAVMPGYSVSRIAEGTMYYLFTNFKQMLKIADRTEGAADNNFLAISIDMYDWGQKDLDEQFVGRESFFYAWMEQTWDYGGDSLLGQGKHIYLLKRMTGFSKNTDLFKQAIKQYKTALGEDLSNPDATETHGFREPKAKRAKEIDEILTYQSPLLTADDTAAIQKVRDGF
jgi:hypothetical protein